MTSETIMDILEKAGLFGKGASYSDYVRFPCPFRMWNHGKGQRTDGKNCYWIEVETLRSGCYVCGDRGTLWQVLAFRSLLDQRPYLWDLADKVLELTEKNGNVAIDEAFENGQKKLMQKKVNSQYALDILASRFNSFAGSDHEMSVYFEGERFIDPLFVMNTFGVRYDFEEERICHPLFSMHDETFKGIVGRAIRDDIEPKTKFYYGTKQTETFGCSGKSYFWDAKRFLVVEGQFDLYRIHLSLKGMDMLSELYPVCLNTSRVSDEQAALFALYHNKTLS